MDFAFSEEQQALSDLASSVFGDRVTHDRLRSLEQAGPSVFDRELWSACAQSGLLGAVVPTDHGGAGLGLLALLPVFEEQGRAVAPVPLVETTVAALALARFGTADQQAALLPGVASGEVVLTTAFDEGPAGDPVRPTLDAVPDGDGWRVSGDLPFVSYGAEATRVLALAGTDGAGVVLLLLDPTAEGVEVTELGTTNRQPQAAFVLDGVTVSSGEVVGGPGDAPDAARWIAERAAASWCAVQAGVCDGAVRMTAGYVSERTQFDKRIAEFQAVAQRAADAFIDTQMIQLTARHALYLLSQDREASQEVHAAKFWAGDGAMRVVHAAQHLHGGIGVDLDYPVHRYFLWAKRIEHTLGTPTRELIRLGDLLAAEPV